MANYRQVNEELVKKMVANKEKRYTREKFREADRQM